MLSEWSARPQVGSFSFVDWNERFVKSENEQVVKEFWQEATSQRGGFFTGGKLMWHWPVESNAVGCSSRAEPLLIFWLRTPQQWLANVFSWAGLTTPNFTLSLAGSGPSSTWFPGHTRVCPPIGILIGWAVLQGLRTWPTDRHTTTHTHIHTDHAAPSVTIGRV